MVYFSQLMLGDRRESISSQERYEQLLEEVRLLDELSYDTVWFAEHHFSGYALLPNSLMIAAAAARETHRIRIGAGVVVLPFHHPVRVAEDAAMVDCLSQGRLNLGLGRGYQPIEFFGFGQTVEASKQRFNEALGIVVDILSDPDGAGNYEGSLFSGRQATLWPKPLQRPIPFWGASVSEESFARYGALGWPILTFPANQEPASFQRQVETYRAAFREGGHDPRQMRIAMTMFTYTHPDRDEANRVFEAGMRQYFGFLERITQGAESKQQSFYVEIPTLARLSGTPEEVRTRVREIVDEFGVTDIVNVTQFAGYLSHQQTLDSIRLFDREVITAFVPAQSAAR